MHIVVAELCAVNSPCCGQTLWYPSGKGLSQTEKPKNNKAGGEEERGFGSTPKPPETQFSFFFLLSLKVGKQAKQKPWMRFRH